MATGGGAELDGASCGEGCFSGPAINQDFRFSSFPRMRESSHSLKRMDTRLLGYDEFTGLAKVLF